MITIVDHHRLHVQLIPSEKCRRYNLSLIDIVPQFYKYSSIPIIYVPLQVFMIPFTETRIIFEPLTMK